MSLARAGFAEFSIDPKGLRWADAALRVARKIAADPAHQTRQLRHGGSWFVGVDMLPNAPDGSIAGVPLSGGWQDHIDPPAAWHRAQLSIVYPGYPNRDPQESQARHDYRTRRFAAHVDGLLAKGPNRRRYLKEPHGFVLGLPLNACAAAPLMVWPGSHLIIGAALRAAIGVQDPETVDLTDAYHAARRAVFDQITPQPLRADPGGAFVLHRHLLHGIAPWPDGQAGPAEGRMVAYFRPQIPAKSWVKGEMC